MEMAFGREVRKLAARKLLIAGIDPGTTTGYAALDIKGNIVKIGSAKNMGLDALVSELVKHGKILIAGTDKRHSVFAERFATKVGAKLIVPKYNLSVSEKNRLTKEFKTKNSHEADALASALYAFKENKPLLKKIYVFLEKEGKLEMLERVTEEVVLKKKSRKHILEEMEH